MTTELPPSLVAMIAIIYPYVFHARTAVRKFPHIIAFILLSTCIIPCTNTARTSPICILILVLLVVLIIIVIIPTSIIEPASTNSTERAI